MLLAESTTVEHVRLRRARVDAPVARLRLSHLLSSASLQPPAMPPSAILLVRTMDDPLPGRIAKGFAPGSIASVEWERAARNQLGELYRGAARPLWQTVSSSAAAVLFADFGELLACLARDLAAGAPLGWWWQSILRRISVRLPGSWVAAWMEKPLFIPAALHHLEERRKAVGVLERISPVQAWNLLTAVLQAYNLPGLALTRGTNSRLDASFIQPEPAEEHTAGHGFALRRGAALDDQARPPWTSEISRLPWEPHVSRSSTPPELGYERQALLGIGLMLHRAPQAAFRTVFSLQFRAWVKSQESGETRRPADSPAPNEMPGRRTAGERSDTVERRASRPGPSGPASAAPAEGASRRLALSRSDRAPAETVTPAGFLAPAKSPLAEPETEILIPLPVREWADGVSTRVGGLLYLIHFVRQAELLRHFDTGLSAWALLELLARCLLDHAGNVEDDAIWSALAHLDGREPGTPPCGFQPSATYEAPDSWLPDDSSQAAAGSRFARFRSRGLEIWTEQGYLVLDSTDHLRPSGKPRLLDARLRRKFRQRSQVRPISLTVSPELRRFLHFVLPYARWRLDRALGGTSIEEALMRKGELYVTATHVDLVMPMSEIRVPVRMAGLDANPGWVPQFGRVINFHFT